MFTSACSSRFCEIWFGVGCCCVWISSVHQDVILLPWGKKPSVVKCDKLVHSSRRVCVCVCVRVFNSDLAVHVFSYSRCLCQAWWRFNPVPLYTYAWLVVVVISAEDIPPSSLYWSGPGHWGVKSKEKEKIFALVFYESLTVCRTNWLLQCTCAWHHCCERKVWL